MIRGPVAPDVHVWYQPGGPSEPIRPVVGGQDKS